MSWWAVLLLKEFAKFMPVIVNWIIAKEDKSGAAQSFIDHMKSFKME